MPRKPRIHLPGGVYHVMLRGNGGQDIFFEKNDRLYFYDLLAEGIERFGYRVHGFCLMTNHLHLVLQVDQVPLSRLIHNLASRYSHRVNWRRTRSGHLFQGRFKAVLVDGDSYLLELVRYVHLNPVRAKLVTAPEAYPWSGHRAYLGRERLGWLTTEWVLGQIGKGTTTSRRRYEAFVRDGMGEGHRRDFHYGSDDSRVLADDNFLEEMMRRADEPAEPPALESVVRAVCEFYGIDLGLLAGPSRRRQFSEARAVIGHFARLCGAASLSDVAAAFGRDLSSLSRGVRRVEMREVEDPDFAVRLQSIHRTIAQ